MSISKRLLSLFLCLLMIFSLVACNSDANLESSSGSDFSAVPANYISIAEAQAVNYRIVYAKDLSPSVISVITQNITTIQQKVGAVIQAVSDEALPAPIGGMPEILIGETNREATATFISELEYKEYGYVITED